MKYILALFVLFAMACTDANEGNDSYESANTTQDSSKLDNMPIITPQGADTSRVVTPPPTGDSNVINTDTSNQSR